MAASTLTAVRGGDRDGSDFSQATFALAACDVSAGAVSDVQQDSGVKLHAGDLDCPSVVLGDGSAVLIVGSTGSPAPNQVWAEPIHPGS